jgi:4-amino-4-deoxy-L-arabinose transferase-like glycosyltransferase
VTPRRFFLLLGLIALLGLGLRWFWILEVRPECGIPPEDGPAGCLAIIGGTNDPRYLHEVGNLLAEGKPYVDPFAFAETGEERPSAHKMPLFPAYLGVVSLLGGQGVETHRLAAALLGVGAVVVLGLVGRALGGPRAGLLAAAIAALYPNLWINDFLLQVESLAALLMALVLLVAYRYAATPSRRLIVLLGALIALTGLTRAETLLLYALVALPIVLRAIPDWRERLFQLAMAGAAGLVIVGPWMAWNLARFEEPTTLSTAPGPVLDTASCDATYYGDQLGYYASCFAIEDYAEDEGLTVDEAQAQLKAFDESERAAVAGARAQTYIRDHLGRLPVVMAARVARLWELYRPAQNVRFNWQLEARGERTSQAALLSYYALIPAAVGGLVVLRRRGLPLSPLLGPAIMITVTAAWTFGTTRYRIPADVALVVAAAVGVDALLRRWWPVDEGEPASEEVSA